MPSRTYQTALFYLALATPALVPFVCPYPPFQDWPGHVGVIGALAHMDEPNARILEFYDYVGWFKLNNLFYVCAFLLAKIMSPLAAANVMFALSVGGLGPAMARLCSAVGTDRRIALLVLPLAVGRHVYCGFVTSSAALVLMLLAFAAYYELRRKPSPRYAVELVIWLVLLPFMHAFVFLSGVGLLLIAVLWDALRAPRRAPLLGLGAIALSSLAFLLMASRGLGHAFAGSSGPTAFEATWTAIKDAPRQELMMTFWEWLFASYRYTKIDDWLQAVWCGFVFFGFVGAVAYERRQLFGTPRLQLVVLALVTVAMFYVLPTHVGPPLHWWGARLRLPPVALLLLIPMMGTVAPSRIRQLPTVVGAVCVAMVLAGVWDLGRYARTEMAGFTEVLDAIPPGKKLTALHYTQREVYEYPGQPHGYLANYYLAAKGGAVPQNFFERSEVPFLRKVALPAPPWAIAGGFRWARHGQGYDAFLVRRHPTVENAPFTPSDLERIELVKSAGNWRYYRSRTSTTTR